MNVQADLCDEKFVLFLQSLGVETYKKSFEWMFDDSDFAGILLWLYNNLDHNNALSAREEYRYTELEKRGLLSPEELQSTILAIQQCHPGISLSGDQESLEDAKQDICILQERLHVLERQEGLVKDLILQNELIKKELNVEITKLNSTYLQYVEDGKKASEECLQLVNQVESVTDSVCDLVADTLNIYANCHTDIDIAKKFIRFGPLDSYKQTQALFCSHFDLYTSKKFKRQHDFTDEDLKTALIEARSMEERLSHALCSYIDSKAELAGEQAKLALVENYNHVHPSQITVCSMEAQTALDLLAQEESILEQQTQTAVKELVAWRTKLAVDTASRSAFTVRQQVHADLSYLLEICHQALALDRILYYGLRHELRTVEDLLQFAAQLKEYVVIQNEAVASRIDSMNSICAEQTQCELKLQSSDALTQALSSILETTHIDSGVLVKVYNDLVINVQALFGDVKEGYRRKEERLRELKSSLQPLQSYIFDGCTKQPNCRDRTVATLMHTLQTEMDTVEKRVLAVGGLLTTTKNADKHNLRKLWQWFLTDEARLLTAMRGMPMT
ncbi:uncharacterized protein LOC113230975 [Hyposmocoma kahamanoa]|uniref:uncharacterized protein LOC113230975 n=1 Tax=Hyposmocoma kahamanoa TaxID=1477025 RepID=UPI000E6D73B9|nr:uncharacterized protein LOC113230975 [Hyposmocoma kahamanoa]